jgi:hypothetical protein
VSDAVNAAIDGRENGSRNSEFEYVKVKHHPKTNAGAHALALSFTAKHRTRRL